MLIREIIAVTISIIQENYITVCSKYRIFSDIGSGTYCKEMVHIVTILLYGITAVQIDAMLGICPSIVFWNVKTI
jgi:hypothetical protein